MDGSSMNSNFLFPGGNAPGDQAQTKNAAAPTQGGEFKEDPQVATIPTMAQGSLLQEYLQQQQQQQLVQVPQQQDPPQFSGTGPMGNLTTLQGVGQGVNQKVGFNLNAHPSFDVNSNPNANAINQAENWGNAGASSNISGTQGTSGLDLSISDQMLLAQRAQTGGDMNAALMGSTMGGGGMIPGGPMSMGGDFSAQERLLAFQTLQAQRNEGGANAAAVLGGGFNAAIGGTTSMVGGQGTGNIAAANQMLLAQQLNMQGPAGSGSALAGVGGANAGGLAALSPPTADTYAAHGLVGPWSERAAGLMGSMVCSNPSAATTTKVKRPRRKQPKDKPKRPLSAYNIFFKEERARLMEQGSIKRTANGKIGFESLAKIIGGKWQDLNPKEAKRYKEQAAKDMKRYREEMEVYKKKQKASKSDEGEKGGEEDSASKSSESADADADADAEQPSKKQKLQKEDT